MPLTKVLITVKTYPSLSAKYGELVCTAGFLEEVKGRQGVKGTKTKARV